MPKYAIDYRMISNHYVVVEAESWEEAEKMLHESPNPAFEIGGEESDLIDSDLDYDDYFISEVEE